MSRVSGTTGKDSCALMTQRIRGNTEDLGGRLRLPETRQEFPEEGEGEGWGSSKGEVNGSSL